ncbi:MAG: TIGR03087 family PEP-CTERM/XrtA system glycosyltransferase [Alphaproteobacteria bacterium]|nr:TIGR03087 family PEP-CTERM/XrtA system glycosyltransferase [Alphaproteobacteria bacterium]
MARILFLAHRIPYPPNKGDKIRSWHFLEHLLQKHDVHLGFYVDSKADLQYVDFLRQRSTSICFTYVSKFMLKLRAMMGLVWNEPLSFAAYPKSKLRRYVKGLLEREEIDLIFLFSGAVGPLIGRERPDFPVIADLVDVDSAKWEAYSKQSVFPLSWLYAREAKVLAEAEAVIARQASITTFVSADEARLFKQRIVGGGYGKIMHLNNGVDVDHFNPERFTGVDPAPNSVIFTGAMDYLPNIEAAEWFVENVWPIVRSRIPEACFKIAGGPTPKRVKQLAQTGGVDVTGYVDDMAEAIAAASVVVAPLRTARGIQNKVLEGMAMAKPVIATAAAKEGIEAQIGKHVLVAEEPKEFADLLISLMADAGKASAIGEAARMHILKHYKWQHSLSEFDGFISELVK